MRITSVFFLLAVMEAGAFGFQNADSTRPNILAVKIAGELHLSGKLDDPRWAEAPVIELPFEVTPGENTPAPQNTRVKILYDDERVYFGFVCGDTHPSEIRAHITDRDKPYDDDFIIVMLDTYGDYQRAYEFLVNPYGIQADLLRTSSNEDDSFDTVWESAAAINDSGWTAEIAVPFKSIRFPSTSQQSWLAEFIRNYPRASRVQTSWVRVDRNNPCLMCQAGAIRGIQDIQGAGASVDILPYVLGKQSGELRDASDPNSSFDNGKISGEVGGGVRYAPTPDFAVEGVVNPDFSQVESDAAQISVNSNFSLFYPEKRPFFLLGMDLLQNQTQTYYSRTINNPIAAGRAAGKSGSLSYMYLIASDRNTPFILPGEETSDFVATERNSVSNIGRVRYDFGGENFLGAMVTTRNTGTTAHNYLGGIDGSYKFWDNFYLSGELFYAHTRELDDTNQFSDTRTFGSTGHDAAFNGEEYGGLSGQLSFRRNARDFSFGIEYSDRAPTFQAQDGFVPANNFRTMFFNENYTFYPNGDLVEQWALTANEGLHYNYDGIRKEKWFLPGVYVQLKGQTSIDLLYFAVNDELYHGTQFDGIHRTQVSVNSRPASVLTLSANGSFGRFIKRSTPVDLGTGHNLNLSAQIRPTSRLELDLSYARAALSSVATDELFYDGYIVRATGIFQFTREIFLRVIGQYDEFNNQVDIYPLVSYKLNPFTIFYAGSTYSLTDFGDPFGFHETARQYFVKLQYLIRS